MQIQAVCRNVSHYCQSNVTFLGSLIKNIRNRKTVIFALLVCIFIVYFMSSYLLPPHRHFHATQVQSARKTLSCLDPFIEKWKFLISENKAVLKEIPGSSKENRFFPFTGNGNIGFSSENNEFYLLTEHESIDVLFSPILKPKIVEKNTFEKKAVILNVKDGVLHVLTSFLLEKKECVVIEETILTHRLHSQLFFYEAVVKNNGMLPVTVKFDFISQSKNLKMVDADANEKKTKQRFTTIFSKIRPKGKIFDSAYVVAALSEYQQTVNVPQKSKNSVSVKAIVKSVTYEKLKSSKRSKKSIVAEQEKKIEEDLIDAALKDIVEIEKIKNEVLIQQHRDAWQQTWEVGSDVSSENDPDAPTALHVNLLHYYIFSSIPYNLTYHPITPLDCSSEAAAAHNADLWSVPTSVKEFYTTKSKWLSYLTLSRCINMENGVSFLALREYMTLVFMGLQYKQQHLQLALNPLNLHSNLSVRNIPLERFYSKDTLDMKIITTMYSSEHVLQVQGTGTHNPKIYGCPVACEYTVELTNNLLSFPVRNTNPVTPIFYISTNKTYLEQLGSSSFLKKAKANAIISHQVDLEVHHFKLSPTFWFAVVVLIVTFHVIVIKMVYNECRRDRSFNRRRVPYP